MPSKLTQNCLSPFSLAFFHLGCIPVLKFHSGTLVLCDTRYFEVSPCSPGTHLQGNLMPSRLTPMCSCRYFAIKNWTVGRPGNEASL